MTKIRSDFINSGSFDPNYDIVIGTPTDKTRGIVDYDIDDLADGILSQYDRILFLDGTHVRTASAATITVTDLVVRMQSRTAQINCTTYAVNFSGNDCDVELNLSAGSVTISGTRTRYKTHDTSSIDESIDGNVEITGTLEATANAALYSDLAEKYTIEGNMEPGLIVSKNRDEGPELKIAEDELCPDVFGVITKNPAYLMNKSSDGYGIVMIGRSPILIKGPVKKWDFIVPAGGGIGRVMKDETERKFAIGSALESINTSVECECECFIKVKR